MWALVGRALAPWAAGARHAAASEPRAACRLFSAAELKEKPDMSRFPVEDIRNFSIIAHVDHGKSTLADRLLELTGTIDKTKKNKQVLDKLQVERERGITVKAQTASLFYSFGGKQYFLNLIDTPGHVDFSYEVSRSLSACQGVLLVVDANEGIQAQTVANFFLAFEAQLSVIPVINKIDLKNADPERVGKQIEKVFDIPSEECIKISAKLGTNVDSVLQAVIERIPPFDYEDAGYQTAELVKMDILLNGNMVEDTVPFPLIVPFPVGQAFTHESLGTISAQTTTYLKLVTIFPPQPSHCWDFTAICYCLQLGAGFLTDAKRSPNCI